MYRLPHVLVLILSFSSSFLFQISQPTAIPNQSDDDVVKISTNLIQLDVVVTYDNGNQITDLQPADFENYENGEI